MLFIGLVLYTFPAYWNYQFSDSTYKLPTGVTEEGHHWIGSANPALTIEEFTDYQCFQCRKNHYFLRQLMSKNPEHIRLIHRHYPMDNEFNSIIVPQPFHVGSGKMALIALAAGKYDKFWEMNDLLYEVARNKEKEIDLKALAKQIGIAPEEFAATVYSAATLHKLQIDIREGLRNNIIGTPSYLSDGQVFIGSLPAKIFEGVLQ